MGGRPGGQRANPRLNPFLQVRRRRRKKKKMKNMLRRSSPSFFQNIYWLCSIRLITKSIADNVRATLAMY